MNLQHQTPPLNGQKLDLKDLKKVKLRKRQRKKLATETVAKDGGRKLIQSAPKPREMVRFDKPSNAWVVVNPQNHDVILRTLPPGTIMTDVKFEIGEREETILGCGISYSDRGYSVGVVHEPHEGRPPELNNVEINGRITFCQESWNRGAGQWDLTTFKIDGEPCKGAAAVRLGEGRSSRALKLLPT